MILWGGTVAPDIGAQGLDRIRRIRRRVLVFGDADQYADEERVLREDRLLRERGIPFELIRFAGGHRIDRETLGELIRSPR